MGFITLSTNESTGFKSRELQSVNVGPHRGTHLKLRLGAAHANRHNSFHQVALIAVNVLGTELSADGTDEVNEQLAASATDVVPLSVCDDLSFSMYVDESVADVVREMESKKSAAVNGEWNRTFIHRCIFTYFGRMMSAKANNRHSVNLYEMYINQLCQHSIQGSLTRIQLS